MDHDPPRLGDDRSPEWDLRNIILERGNDFEPTDEDLENFEGRLAPLLNPSPPSPPVPPTPRGIAPSSAGQSGQAPAGASGATSASVASRALLIGATALAVSGAAWLLWPTITGSQSSTTRPVQSTITARITVLTPTPSPDESPGAAEQVRVEPTRAEPSKALEPAWTKTPRRDDQLRPRRPRIKRQEASPAQMSTIDELELLQRASRALRAGQPALALELAQEHLRRGGRTLAQERERIAIEALIGLGQTARARARAERISQSFPGSEPLPRPS